MSEGQPECEYTERMVPESAHARIFWEHIGRYRFARRFVRGKRVLDIACGEGYGAAGLVKAGAASVIGVDVSAEACENARRKYGLDSRIGQAQRIPLPDRCVDLVVSFETIEHVDDPAAFLLECTRVLVPEGLLIVSTPNRPVYSPEGTANPFHQVEFSRSEFLELLERHFRAVRLYTQFPQTAAPWSLRSLPAERSPWLRIKGFWRLSSWFCPAIRTHVAPATRASADLAVLDDDRFPSSLFSPYVVRPYSEGSRERPYVFVAVAEGVRAQRSDGAGLPLSRPDEPRS
ncbi:MAG: class I SAM-dependent methyltransferase [Isosphaeraceae bacterium]|nr:class I SAM-dependent methyltransferase [Isosphaeraceae bacterium]